MKEWVTFFICSPLIDRTNKEESFSITYFARPFFDRSFFRKVFSAHFGQLSIIFLWLSGMYFHGAGFSNYEAWLSDPTHIGPSAQVVWPIVGQKYKFQVHVH